MYSEKSEILIDRYLAGELQGAKLAEFENSLENDENLQETIRFQSEVIDSLKDTGKIRLRQTLNDVHNDSTKNSRFTIYSWKIQTIAATLLITILLGGTLVINNITQVPINQQLYEDYFSPESALLTVRSDKTSVTPITIGMNYYVQENYTEAITSFKKDASDMLGRLYTGFSYMHLEQYKLAELEFKFILTDNDNLFLDQAEWNLGLCYLVSGKIDSASRTFASISEGNTVYNKRALQLLNKMGETN